MIEGPPQPLSRTAQRPRGPSVVFTARASLVTPASRRSCASCSNTICFAMVSVVSFDFGLRAVARTRRAQLCASAVRQTECPRGALREGGRSARLSSTAVPARVARPKWRQSPGAGRSYNRAMLPTPALAACLSLLPLGSTPAVDGCELLLRDGSRRSARAVAGGAGKPLALTDAAGAVTTVPLADVVALDWIRPPPAATEGAMT